MTEFEALYERYARDIYRFALYLCGERATAEDITMGELVGPVVVVDQVFPSALVITMSGAAPVAEP